MNNKFIVFKGGKKIKPRTKYKDNILNALDTLINGEVEDNEQDK